jgi:hypothetical protein
MRVIFVALHTPVWYASFRVFMHFFNCQIINLFRNEHIMIFCLPFLAFVGFILFEIKKALVILKVIIFFPKEPLTFEQRCAL